MNIKLLIKSVLFFFISIHIVNAGIINKDPYAISGENRNKKDISIAVLFSGSISDERKYLMPLFTHSIENCILSYKKIRVPETIPQFRRYEWIPSGGVKTDKAVQESCEDNFLEVIKCPEDKINEISKIIKSGKRDSLSLSEINIIITGNIFQSEEDIDIELKVYNNIYGNVTSINKKDSIKDVDKLLENLYPEILKAVISDYGLLNVKSDEKNAFIYIDGRSFGRTDKDNIIIEPGPHEVTVSMDQMSSAGSVVNIEEGSSKTVLLSPGKMPLYGKISITSNPEKARVYIDSGLRGVTPLIITNLEKGNYRLRIDMDGYITQYRTVNIAEGSSDNIVINLEKGDNKEHYFSRTDIYYTLFKYTLIGTTICAFTYVYIGMKIEDKRADLRGFEKTHTPEEYLIYKKKNDKKVNELRTYRSISLYTAAALLISAGIFFYLDVSQDDIDIALYNPDLGRRDLIDSGYTFSVYNPSVSYKSIGCGVTLYF